VTVVSSIVEGDGEVVALPILLRRLHEWRSPALRAEVLRPIRVKRDQFLNKEDEFKRHLQLAAAKCGDDGWVLVLLDADDDCPAQKGAEVLARANAVIPHRAVAVVFANREFEAWFIASAMSLNGQRGFLCRANDDRVEAEIPRNAKGWMGERMAGGGYGETTDQPAFAARFDMALAYERSRSFRKLCEEWSRKFA
jgi:hypothetical protein